MLHMHVGGVHAVARAAGAILATASIAVASEETEKGSLWSQVSVRQTVVDKNAIEKPATVQVTWPADGKASYAVDCGITASLIKESAPAAARWLVGPTVEYHRRTETDKQQDTLSAGMTVLHIGGDITQDQAVHFTQGTLSYKRDGVKDTNGLQGTLTYTPLVPRVAIGVAKGSRELKLLWQPSIGGEFEVNAGGKQEGSAGRLSAGVDAGIYPGWTLLSSRLVLSGTFTYWWDVMRSKDFETGSDHHHLLSCSVSYYTDAEQHVGIGVDYLDGENPLKGMMKQRLWQLSFRVKV